MKKVFKIFVILALAISYSCTKDVENVKFPDYKRKFVISGFLSPDEEKHYISVGYNEILYSGAQNSLNFGNLTGTLSDGENVITLRPVFHKIFTPSFQDSVFEGFVFTSSELPVIEGKTYKLNVFNENMFAEASCTVPYKRDLLLTFDTVRVPYQNYPQSSYLQTDISFTEIAGEENYYSLLCEQVIYPLQNQPGRLEVINLVDPKYSYFNDKGIDGKRLKIRLKDVTRFGSNYSAELKIYLLNTDKPYYDYHKSTLNYVSGEIPFTEASPIYSNVKGGLGIFAAYTCDSIFVRLK